MTILTIVLVVAYLAIAAIFNILMLKELEKDDIESWEGLSERFIKFCLFTCSLFWLILVAYTIYTEMKKK